MWWRRSLEVMEFWRVRSPPLDCYSFRALDSFEIEILFNRSVAHLPLRVQHPRTQVHCLCVSWLHLLLMKSIRLAGRECGCGWCVCSRKWTIVREAKHGRIGKLALLLGFIRCWKGFRTTVHFRSLFLQKLDFLEIFRYFPYISYFIYFIKSVQMGINHLKILK